MRYHVEYASTTGYGWSEKSDSLRDYSSLIKAARTGYDGGYYMHLIIWDEKKHDFVFWKRALYPKPDIDLIGTAR